MSNLKYLLLALCLFGINKANAQEAYLDAALLQYKFDFEPFRNTISQIQTTTRTITRDNGNTIVKAKDIYAALYAIDAERDQKSGFLFYTYAHEKLTIFFANSTGLQAKQTLEVSLDSLFYLEGELRRALGVDLFSDISRSANTLRGVNINNTAESPAPRDLQSVLKDISSILLPFEIQKNLDLCSHLYIVPCYNLYTIPFSCLKRNEKYLINTHSYTLIPSIYDWLAEAQEEVYNPLSNQYLSKSYSACVIGNPTYYQGADSLDKMFNDLPVAMMQSYVAATLFEDMGGENLIYLTQQNASKTNVLQTIPKTRDMIYIATHGVVNMNNPLDESYLAFAPDQSSPTDFWTNREILQTTLQSKVAVLSACNTGIGQNQAVGQFSLANSFYFAGVDDVLVTLWSVDDN